MEFPAYRIQGEIAYLTLNCPPANATSLAFFSGLRDLLPRLRNEKKARGLIVTGHGRHFSAGADIDELRVAVEGDGAYPEFPRGNVEILNRFENLPYPTVAAIGGCCLGSGLELALVCTYRVATPRAVLGLPETGFGLMPGCGGTIRLPKLIGKAAAIRMVLGGQSVLGEEAREMGLVDAIVEKDTLLSRCEHFLQTTRYCE